MGVAWIARLVELHFKVVYIAGGREGQAVAATDYVDDGRSIVFRDKMPDGSFYRMMSVRANVVDHIETLPEDAQMRFRFGPRGPASPSL